MRRIFEVDGRRFAYEYGMLDGERVIVARRIAELHIERQQSPPRSINELKLTGDHLWEAEVFAYLLTELDEEGRPMKWDRNSSPDEARDYFLRLPASQMEVIELCKQNFFVKARIVRPDAIARLQRIMSAMQGESTASTTGESDESEPVETQSEPGDSTSPVRSADESSSDSTTLGSG